MADGHLEDFLAVLGRGGSQRQAFVAAFDLLHGRPSSEFSRIADAVDIHLGRTLGALDISAKWRIVDAPEDAVAPTVLLRMLRFVDRELPHELSSQLVAQVALRTSWAALDQIRMALGGHVQLPNPNRIMEIAVSARRITCAVPVCAGMPSRGRTCEAVAEPDAADLRGFQFGHQVLRAMRHQLDVNARVDRAAWLESTDLMRAAVGRGADQRIARWFQGLGFGIFDFARAPADEERAGETLHGLPVSMPAMAVHQVLMWLARLSGQAPSTDRVLLACLATSDSYLARRVRAIVGDGCNLPLLYIRTARPPGLSVEEAQWLIQVGDADSRPSPSPMAYDLSPTAFSRLRNQALNDLGFDAASRLTAYYLADGPAFTHAPHVDPAPFQTGDALALAEQLDDKRNLLRRGAARFDDVLNRSFAQEVKFGRGKEWAYRAFLALHSTDPAARLNARLALAACQPGPAALRELAAIGVATSADELQSLGRSGPMSAYTAVAVAHALDNGVRPYPALRHRGVVHLHVGGTDGDFHSGIAAADQADGHRFTLSAAQAHGIWTAVREAARAHRTDLLHQRFLEIADLTGIARWQHLLNGALVDFTAMRPFDSFLLERAIRAVAKPAGLVHRVFGAGPGRWQGQFEFLQRSGGQRIVVADPSESLRGAAAEAQALAQVADAHIIGGSSVLRSTVVRSLEVERARPQLLHFAGHGLSGLALSDGSLASGVLAGDREAVTVEAIGDISMPRVLVASACDVGSTPPSASARGWATSAIARGSAYSVAAGVPVDDAAALVFMVLVYRSWREGTHLESAMSDVTQLSGSPSRLLAQWRAAVPLDDVGKAGVDFIRGSSSQDIDHNMKSFLLAAL
ncbi:CHAT domain-containing protein [Streptomyces sp. NPDC059697]|uniref:CHAT domain-containing protein n=1 Tax=Streptomyces sp. NPDC059697 TaxID=3346912 RepID=UPI00368677CD